MAQYGNAWIGVRADTSAIPKDIDQAVRKAGSQVKQIGSTVASDIARTTAQAAAGVTALGAAAGASLVKVGLGYNALEQSSLAAFETLLGTKDAAEEMQASLREFAKSSPFPRQAFIEGTQRLLAFGVEADKVIHYLDGVQNAVAAAGGSATDLSNIVEVLAKIRSSAMFNIIDLTQLGNAGINAAKLIGGSMSMTEQEFRDSIFGAPLRGAAAMDAMDALVEGMHREFAGAAEGLKNTWVGSIDRIKGAWRDLGSELVDPFVTRGGGGFGVGWANDLADTLRHIEKVALPPLGPLVDHIAGSMDGAAKSAVDWVQAIRPTDVARRLVQVVDGVDQARDAVRGLEGVAVGAGIALAGMGARTVLGPLGFLVPAISPITGVLVGLVAGAKDGRDELAKLGGQAGEFASGPGRDLVAGLARFVDEIDGPVVRVLTTLGGGLLDIASGAIPSLVSGMDDLGPPVGRIAEAFADLVDGVLPSLVSIVEKALPVGLDVTVGVLTVAATAAEILADNAWLIVPALGAVAAYRMGSALTTWMSTAAEGARYLFESIQGIAGTRGVSTLAATANVTKSSVGNLAGSMTSLLNPALVGVTVAVGAGIYAWSQYRANQEKVKQSTRELTDALLEQGAEVVPTLVVKFNEIAEAGKGMQESFDKTGWSSARLAEIIAGNPGDWDRAMQQWNDVSMAPDRMRHYLDELPPSVRGVWRELLNLHESGVLTTDDVRKIAQGWKEVDQAAVGTEANLKRMATQFEANSEGVSMTARAQEALNTALSDNASLQERRDALEMLAGAFPGLAAESGIFLDANNTLREEITRVALSAEDASEVLNTFGNANRDVSNDATAAATGLELTTESVESLDVSVKDATESIRGLIGKLAELAGGRRAVSEAERGVFESLDRAREALDDEDRSRSFDPRDPDGRRNIEDIGRVIEAYERLAEARAKMGDSEGARRGTADMMSMLRQLRTEGIIPTDTALRQIWEDFNVSGSPLRVEVAIAEAQANLAELAGELEGLPGGPRSGPMIARVEALMDEGKIDEAIALLQSIPGVMEAEQAVVEAHADELGIERTRRELQELTVPRELFIHPDLDMLAVERARRKLRDSFSDVQLMLNPGAFWGWKPEGERASGGPVYPGWWLVGERGPELLKMTGTGHVFNNAQTERMLDSKSVTGDQFTAAMLNELRALRGEVAAMQVGGTLQINQHGGTADTSITDLLEGLDRAQKSGRLPAGFRTTRVA